MKYSLESVKLKNIFITLMLTAMSQQSFAQSVVKKFKAANSNYNMSSDPHSFCYRDRTGQLFGHNPHKMVTIASVSKLITTLWAIEELGVGYKYETKFYLKDKRLHIAGDLDPVFSSRKLFVLLNELNQNGVTELEEITFDKNVRVFTKAEGYVGEFLTISDERTAANLRDFWNTPNWNNLKAAYNAFVKSTPDQLVDRFNMAKTYKDLNLKIGSVKMNEENTVGEEGLVHFSPVIERYLKYLNIQSNNYMADQIFEKLGGEVGFDNYMKKIETELNADILEGKDGDKPLIKMYTGSGLNTTRDGSRVDNEATCGVTVALIDRLEDLLLDGGSNMQSVVAVPGTDGGTFKSRLKSARFNKTIVAKTGTLYHTSALAGSIYGVNSKVTFGVFHQLTGYKGNAKAVQNQMVKDLWETYAPNEKFSYTPTYFFPATTKMSSIE